jgi:8-oxo-dGTP diphosphatase
MTDLGTARPHIASYVILRDGNKVALLLRENTSWMAGYYGLPAGKVEHNESFIAGAIREAQEEVGVTVGENNLRHVLTMHRKSDADMTWVDVFFVAENWEGKPYNAEPEIHGSLDWIDQDNLPENIIPNVKFALEEIQKGTQYCEFDWV